MSKQKMSHCKEIEKFRAQAYRMLCIKGRSRRQVYEALLRKGATEDVAAMVVSALSEQGLLDDIAFAREFTEQFLARKPCGPRFLLAALLRAGVDRNTCHEALDEIFSEEREKELAVQLVHRLLKKTDKSRLQILRHLKYRGFSENASCRALAEEFGCCLDIIP
ncbi:MAG: regulatory protein RecX [Dethiobacter sp.]|nr:regulatory protein RecX [Dethiobacter sp.]